MNDLQLSLLVIGGVVIAAVYLYNRLQERGLRRRMQQAFGSGPDDILLQKGPQPAPEDVRIEPQLSSLEAAPAASARRTTPQPPAAPSPTIGFDAMLDYVAEIEAEGPISDTVVGELMSRAAACGKPVRCAGQDGPDGPWEEVVRGRSSRYARLRVALQLVNRSGAVKAAQLASFCDAVRISAERAGARAECPDPHQALASARELDAFCGGVDVAVGVNVVAAEGATFAGMRIRAAAEAIGFKLEPDGIFHFLDEQRRTLFTLDNHEPAPFLPESIKGLTTPGVTLLLDVPRVANGGAVLDRMLAAAGELAAGLGGALVDDNRTALTEAGIDRIREQVRSIHAAMDARGITPGGPRALRLFS